MPNLRENFPSSTRTVKALSEVEAFALGAENLRYVASQFKQLHSKKLQHAFRYYSHQWRTWGVFFIQAAWRRYAKRKLVKELMQQESYYNGQYNDDSDEEEDGIDPGDNANNAQHLGATILASKFAANIKRGGNHKGPVIVTHRPRA